MLSAREALEKFGIKGLSQRAEKFKEASKKVKKIQTKNECYMILEQKAYLSRIGVDEKHFIDRESDSSSDSDCDESDISESSNEIGDDEEVINQEKIQMTNVVESTMAKQQENRGEFGKERSVEANHNKDKSEFYTQPIDVSLLGKKNSPQFEINSVLALDTLREVEYNWFAFVATLRPRFYAHGYTDEVLNQFLIDFSSQLPHLGLKEEELRFINCHV